MVDGHTKLHQTEHQAGGLDEIPQGSLLPQDPTVHQGDHLLGGPDELSGIDATQLGDGRVTNTEYYMLDGVNTASQLVTKDQLDSAVQGLDWQESVLDRHDPNNGIPSSPSEGDRYLSTGTAEGWNADSIYEWNGSSWVETVPDEGFVCEVEDEDVWYQYDGTLWSQWGTAVDHGNLLGLQDDDHTQYLLIDGSRAMSGILDMDGNYIENTGTLLPHIDGDYSLGHMDNQFYCVYARTITGGTDTDGFSIGSNSDDIWMQDNVIINGHELNLNNNNKGIFKPRIIEQSSEPTVEVGEMCIWRDTSVSPTIQWLILNYAGTNNKVELA